MTQSTNKSTKEWLQKMKIKVLEWPSQSLVLNLDGRSKFYAYTSRCKKNNGSIIWRWFGFKRSADHQSKVICRQCNKHVATHAGSTTNLFHHLQLYEISWRLCCKPDWKAFCPKTNLFTSFIYSGRAL